MDFFEFDLHKKKLITDCNLHPTEIKQSDTPWLYAINNKYTEESIDSEKTGKWMLFLSKERVNKVWDKIKAAITEGNLWQSKVSTGSENPNHAIMIYTKDYTDLNDVIHVLDYLEASGIKPSNTTIKYKTDLQTYTGVYRGSSQKPWIYSSDSIRKANVTPPIRKEQFFNINLFEFKFDLHKKKLVSDCNLHPTELKKSNTPWLYAINNKYTYSTNNQYTEESIDSEKTGKWMLFLSKERVNKVWDKIKAAIAEGNLWQSKVSTTDDPESAYAIMIYTKDYTDLNDVIHVLNYLETSGIKPPRLTIKYKTDEQTRAGIHRGVKQNPWLYSSDTIRRSTVTQHSNSLFWRDNQPSNQTQASGSNYNAFEMRK